MPFGTNNRRHAWDFPAKPDGFKLGGLLLERNKRSVLRNLIRMQVMKKMIRLQNNTLTRCTICLVFDSSNRKSYIIYMIQNEPLTRSNLFKFIRKETINN
ncbi:hypothetical protein DOY81_012607 [Sarcophaga bullata]|nr:hypothetical protein DOY81_012607 [Sarcophaga bullata]